MSLTCAWLSGWGCGAGCSWFLQVSTLVSLHFLSLMSAGDNLDAPRYKVCAHLHVDGVCVRVCVCGCVPVYVGEC